MVTLQFTEKEIGQIVNNFGKGRRPCDRDEVVRTIRNFLLDGEISFSTSDYEDDLNMWIYKDDNGNHHVRIGTMTKQGFYRTLSDYELTHNHKVKSYVTDGADKVLVRQDIDLKKLGSEE